MLGVDPDAAIEFKAGESSCRRQAERASTGTDLVVGGERGQDRSFGPRILRDAQVFSMTIREPNEALPSPTMYTVRRLRRRPRRSCPGDLPPSSQRPSSTTLGTEPGQGMSILDRSREPSPRGSVGPFSRTSDSARMGGPFRTRCRPTSCPTLPSCPKTRRSSSCPASRIPRRLSTRKRSANLRCSMESLPISPSSTLSGRPDRRVGLSTIFL